MEAASTHREQTPDTTPAAFGTLFHVREQANWLRSSGGQVAAVVLMQHLSDIYQTKALGSFQAAAPLGPHAFWRQHCRNQRTIPSWSPSPHVK